MYMTIGHASSTYICQSVYQEHDKVKRKHIWLADRLYGGLIRQPDLRLLLPRQHILLQGSGKFISHRVCKFISHRVFLKSFCRSQLPHTSVNLSSTITNIKNNLLYLCRSWFCSQKVKSSLCEIMFGRNGEVGSSEHGTWKTDSQGQILVLALR